VPQPSPPRIATVAAVAALCALGNGLGAAEVVAARRLERHPSAFTFPPLTATRVVVRDDGVDVASPAYAARRRFPEPLRVVARDLGGEHWAAAQAAYGTVAVDPARGRMRFFGGLNGPVKRVRRVRLPAGKPLAVARRGKHLFFMTDSNVSGLLVADVSDPRRPRVVASAEKGGAWTQDMLLAGDVAYAAVSGLLYAWHVADPLHPEPLPTLRCGARALAAHGSTLYFVKGRTEVGTVDVADPRRVTLGPTLTFEGAESVEAPRFVGGCMLVGARLRPEALAAQAEQQSPWKTVHLPLKEGFGADAPPRLVHVVYILKLHDGRKPTPLACWVGGPLVGVGRVADTPLALLRASRGGLAFVEVADPAVPMVVSIGGELKGSVALDGRRLYVARGNPWLQDGGLFVYELGDRLRPRLLGKLIEGDRRVMDERSAWRIGLVDGRHVWVLDPIYGILIVDAGDPARPRVVGALPEAGGWRSIAVTDQRVFLGGDPGGLAIVDHRAPEQAERVGSFMVGPALDVAGRGTVAFVANGLGLRIVETADPRRAVELGSLGGIAHARAVALAGRLAFVAGDKGYGDVIDVGDLRAPRRLGRFHSPQARALDAAGHHLYVADAQEGLVVFDVRQPQRPQRVARLAREGGFERVWVRGACAVLGGERGLVVADVSDPRAPRIVSDTRDAVAGPVAGQYTYGAAYYGEFNLLVTEIGAPHRPRVAARYDPGRHSYATDIALRRGLVYLTSRPYLSILSAPTSGQAPTGRTTVCPVVTP